MQIQVAGNTAMPNKKACNGSTEDAKVILPSRWDVSVQITDDGKMILIVACYVQNGWIRSVKIPFSAFSQSLTVFSDLERFVNDTIAQS